MALFFNPYAAVPSMHVAFSLMIAVPAMLIVRNRVAKVLWALYPLLVTFVVIVTGNHWFMDAVAGAVVAGTSALVAAHVLSRAVAGCMVVVSRAARGARVARASLPSRADDGLNGRARGRGNAERRAVRGQRGRGPTGDRDGAELRANVREPADRVAADAELDLDDRPRAERRGGGARHAAAVLPRRASRSSSAA